MKFKEYAIVFINTIIKYTKAYIKRYKTYSKLRKVIEPVIIFAILSTIYNNTPQGRERAIELEQERQARLEQENKELALEIEKENQEIKKRKEEEAEKKKEEETKTFIIKLSSKIYEIGNTLGNIKDNLFTNPIMAGLYLDTLIIEANELKDIDIPEYMKADVEELVNDFADSLIEVATDIKTGLTTMDSDLIEKASITLTEKVSILNELTIVLEKYKTN